MTDQQTAEGWHVVGGYRAYNLNHARKIELRPSDKPKYTDVIVVVTWADGHEDPIRTCIDWEVGREQLSEIMASAGIHPHAGEFGA